MFGAIASIAASAVAVATEKADTRSWRSLPGFYSVARVTLPVGAHKFGIGPDVQEVKISGPYAVVALRSNGRAGGMMLAATPYVEPPPEPVAVPEPVVVPAPVIEEKKTAPVKAPEKKKKG
jgi:hypothetical protein